MEKIYMTSFNTISKPDSDICLDGLNFTGTESFLLISNLPITKHMKVYFEFVINSYDKVSNKRNLPIYAGIHKEPAFGTLNSDFCIGSLFYTEGEDYDIVEKYNKSATNKHSVPSEIYTRIPGATDVIGVGVDYDNNLISFYNNGKLFYSFSPSLFTIKNEENFYLCLWSNIICNMKGIVNFGRNGVQYLPAGYNSFYGEYFRQTASYADINGTITIERPDTWGNSKKEIDGTVTVTNDIMGDGSLSLVSKTATITGLEYKLPYINTASYLYNGGNIFCNLPIPTDRKIYLELYVKDGSVLDNIIGIPASIGISSSKDNIIDKSIRMPLYHKQWRNYEYFEVLNEDMTTYEISDVYTSVPNIEGRLIGVCLNLKENKIQLLVNKVPLYTFKPSKLDFSNQSSLSYLFLHDEGVYTNYITGSFNFGLTKFEDDIPDGYISLYQYYNDFYLSYSKAEIDGTVTVTPYTNTKTVYLSGTVTVVQEEDTNTTIGINRLMKTYNIVSDTEAHQTVDKTFEELITNVRTANNGYFPDDDEE